MTNTPEWHRSDNEYSILLYTLKQDGWRKGEPVMVNDLTIRIENAPGSVNDLGATADRILDTLTPARAEPVAVPVGNPDLNLAAWMDVRRSQLGPWADYLIREVGKLEAEIARMRDHHPAPVTVEAALLQRAVDLIRGDISIGEWNEARNDFVKDALRALSGEKS